MNVRSVIEKSNENNIFSVVWNLFKAPSIGLLAGLLVGAGLIMAAGLNPIEAYRVMVRGIFGGSYQITEVLLFSTPLLFNALGACISFRANIFNIGGDGQYYFGALFGTLIALYCATLPRIPLVLLFLIAGCIGGALWALIPALLKIFSNVNEIISTLLLNYVAIFFITYLVRIPLNDPDGYLPVSAKFPDIVRLPELFGTRIHLGVLLAFILVPIVWFFLWRTPLGLKARGIGSSKSVAQFVGFPFNKIYVLIFLFAGSLAGLAGAIQVNTLHLRLKSDIGTGYAFNGALIALLSRLNPIAAAVVALLFGALEVGVGAMQAIGGVPPQLATSIKAIMVLAVLIVEAGGKWRKRRSI
jgi:general nucleoside transport system permease protein